VELYAELYHVHTCAVFVKHCYMTITNMVKVGNFYTMYFAFKKALLQLESTHYQSSELPPYSS
jgi:hypothetical protein